MRLFNLAPDVHAADMSAGGKQIASNVLYSLGSPWVDVDTAATEFRITDDTTKKALTAKTVTPAKAPVGNTNVLVGLQMGSGALGVQAIALVDAPEGGTCHPEE